MRVNSNMKAPLPSPAPSERTLAAAVHVLSLFFPFLAPLIGYAIFRKRAQFIEAHALSALIDEVVLKILFVVGGAFSLIVTITRVVKHVQENGLTVSWDVIWPIVLKMGITWLAVAILGLYLLVKTLLDAFSAYRGAWPKGMIGAKLAMRASNSSR